MAERNAVFHFNELPGAEGIGNYEYSFLVCHLDDRLFGIPTTEVQEIIPLPPLMSLPQLPESMLGLAKYREEIIPVLDLRKLYSRHLSSDKHMEQMIVINHGRRLCGIAMHDISEILNFAAEDLEPMPSVTNLDNDEFYLGIKRMDEQLVTLLDIGTILDFVQIPTRNDIRSNHPGNNSSTVSRVSVVRLGDVRVGIDIKQIDRIGRVPDIERGDDTLPFLRGFALKEGVCEDDAGDADDRYPIVDLFTVMQTPEDNGKRNVILSAASGTYVGFYAGQVDTIMDIKDEDMVEMPILVQTSDNQFVKTVIKTDEGLVLLLDLNELLHTYHLVNR